MVLTENAKIEISDILRTGLHQKLQNFKKAEDMEKPFYYSLFSTKTVDTAAILQSTYTWFGSQWEKIAEIIAINNSARFQKVKKHHNLGGLITDKEESVIGRIIRELDRDRKRVANISDEINELKKAYNSTDINESYNEEIDLFMKTIDGREIYFELKSAKPNKNEIRAAKTDLLHVLAMRQKEIDVNNVSVYLALPYNQYNRQYDRWTVCKFFTIGKDLLVGKEFWDFLGGNNTYEELLTLFSEIGDEIKDSLEATIENKHSQEKMKKTSMVDF